MNGLEKISSLKEKFLLLGYEMSHIMQKSFEEMDTFIEDANISQLQEGQRSDGTLMPNYSPTSVEVYGKPAGPIKLYDTGDFYRGIEMKATSDSIEITGKDIKTEMLLDLYGDDVLGLTQENKEKIAKEYLQVNISQNIKEYLND